MKWSASGSLLLKFPALRWLNELLAGKRRYMAIVDCPHLGVNVWCHRYKGACINEKRQYHH